MHIIIKLPLPLLHSLIRSLTTNKSRPLHRLLHLLNGRAGRRLANAQHPPPPTLSLRNRAGTHSKSRTLPGHHNGGFLFHLPNSADYRILGEAVHKADIHTHNGCTQLLCLCWHGQLALSCTRRSVRKVLSNKGRENYLYCSGRLPLMIVPSV